MTTPLSNFLIFTLNLSLTLSRLDIIGPKTKVTKVEPNFQMNGTEEISGNHFFGYMDPIRNEFPIHLARASSQQQFERKKRSVLNHSTNLTSELNLTPDDISMMKADVGTKYLVGYDCNNPQSIKPLSSFIADPCTMEPDKDKSHYVVSFGTKYQIVQYETRREYEGYRCEKYVSEYTFYCGNADHGTPYPDKIFSRRPMFVPHETCRRMSSINMYTDDAGKRHRVTPNYQLTIDYYVGGSSVSPHKSWLHGTQLTCTGTKMTIGGVDVDNMVTRRIEEVLYRSEKIIQRHEDGEIIAFHNNVRLSCPIENKYCTTNSVTYIWDIPLKEYCPLYNVKHFIGNFMIHKETTPYTGDKQVVMSTDQSHVRFIVTGEKTECGHKYLTTNYDEILLREVAAKASSSSRLSKRVGEVTRPVPKDEILVSKFIINRDDYLVNFINHRLIDEFSRVFYDNCKSDLQQLKADHFLDRKITGYHTYRLGGANYITAAGEIAYFYKCKPTLVSALSAKHCYDALPIDMPDVSDIRSYQQDNGEVVEVPKYYLEPLTHRITTVAKEQPCIKRFFARYKDVFGKWFAITPTIEPADSPDPLDVTQISHNPDYQFPFWDADLSKGGIYEPEAIDELILWLENNRREEVVVSQLATQVGTLHAGQYISPDQLFPAYTLQGGTWHNFILGKIWGFFSGLGEFFSTLFGVFLFVRIGMYLGKTFMNCYYLYASHGRSPQLLWGFCTETFMTREYWKDNFRDVMKPFRGNFNDSSENLNQLRSEDTKGKLSKLLPKGLRKTKGNDQLENGRINEVGNRRTHVHYEQPSAPNTQENLYYNPNIEYREGEVPTYKQCAAAIKDDSSSADFGPPSPPLEQYFGSR